MVMSKVLSRVTRSVDRHSLLCLFFPLQQQQQQLCVVPILYNQFHSLAREIPNNFVAGNVFLSSRSLFPIQRFGLSSTALLEHSEKEQGDISNDAPTDADARKTNEDVNVDTEVEADLSKDDLIKLVTEKEEQLKSKHEEMEKLKDKFLRSYAELENVMQRTKR